MNAIDPILVLRGMDRLRYHRIELRFSPERDIATPYWVGAEVRNRFLCCAERHGLRAVVDSNPLGPDHFLSKQLAGGFPKALLWDVSGLVAGESPAQTRLTQGRSYGINFLVAGSFVEHREKILRSIEAFADEGLGVPAVRLRVEQVVEHPDAYSLTTFAKRVVGPQSLVGISTLTPLCLMQNRKLRPDSQGYQSRLGGFPSFYQLVSSAVYRLSTLTLLYGDSDLFRSIGDRREWEELNESLVRLSSTAWLRSCSLREVGLRGTPKTTSAHTYKFSGYVGHMTYTHVDPLLVPVVTMMGMLAVGNEVQYGLGRYACQVTNKT